MSVVRVQASALDVGSDVTMQRYSFFEILEICFYIHATTTTCIYSVYFIFCVALLFPQLTIKSTLVH